MTTGYFWQFGHVALHVHSTRSNCFNNEDVPYDYRGLLLKFRSRPTILAVGFTEHVTDPSSPWLLKAGSDLSRAVVQESFEVRRLASMPGVLPRPVTGVECSILPGGMLDLDAAARRRFQIVIASRHGMNEQEGSPDLIWQTMLETARTQEFDVFGHPNRYVAQTEKGWRSFFDLLRKRGIAAEVNLNCLNQPAGVGIETWLGILVESGVLFTLGWDFHNDSQGLFENAESNLALLQQAGVDLTRAMTYRWDRFCDWLNQPRNQRGERWRERWGI